VHQWVTGDPLKRVLLIGELKFVQRDGGAGGKKARKKKTTGHEDLRP
jgi:hypothetical protein